MWRNRNLHILLLGVLISTTTVENSMEAPQKSKNRTAIRSSNIFLGIYMKECKSGYNKGTCTLTFIAALFIIS
jgi:hypothetical protein